MIRLRAPERIFATAALLAGTLCTPEAWAAGDTTTNTTGSTSARATALVAQAVTLFRARRFDEAREAFAHAYELDPKAETLLELGLAELEASHPVEALEHLREYLGRSDAPAAKVDVVRSKWLPRAEAQTARLEVFVRPGAEIRVDGAVAAQADAETPGGPALSYVIATGEHEVTARDGSLVQSEHVVARAGERVEVHFQRIPDALPPAAGFVAGTAGADARSTTHGARAKWITAITFESAAVIAAGVAIGFSVAVEGHASDANALVGQVRAQTGGNSGCLPPSPASACGEVARDRQAERTNAALANGFYAGAGALAVIGVAAFFLWPSHRGPSAGPLRPIPMLGDRTGGIAAMGTW